MEDNILRELQEDMRRDRARQLWDQYSTTILGVSAAIIIGTAVGVAWKTYQAGKSQQLTEQLLLATSLKDDTKRRAALEEVAQAAGGKAQGAIARLKLAEDAEPEEALNLFRENGEQAKDEALRNVSRVLAAHAAIDSGRDAGEIKSVPEGSAFALSWKEAESWQDYASGNKEEALKGFRALAEDVNTPLALRSRAEGVASYLTPDAP